MQWDPTGCDTHHHVDTLIYYSTLIISRTHGSDHELRFGYTPINLFDRQRDSQTTLVSPVVSENVLGSTAVSVHGAELLAASSLFCPQTYHITVCAVHTEAQ
ncbi:unnamed protein product [Pleuronectes platessa]|uniref:Uncharacterized protein n=1 Tax=Pleuronectes platessa TaxID=8262 RepID=A0A9N7YTR5_PLEPL|nr:unnamed protein product [Pleuronectes platessa]